VLSRRYLSLNEKYKAAGAAVQALRNIREFGEVTVIP
jgi:hypothetical protein